MYIVTRCPVHNKPLYGNGQTSTHNLFKCPDCDYSGDGPGAVRHDLPERFIALEAENEKLKRTMRLHAGDCCSLNNEVELFRGHWEDAEKRCGELQRRLEATECSHKALETLYKQLKEELED